MAITFTYQPPDDISLTMGFEAKYHPGLQFDLQEKTDMLKLPDLIGVWMRIDKALVGETYGLPLVSVDEEIPGLDELDALESGIYCYSNTVSASGNGWGTTLKAHWLGICVGLGYTCVYGHARPGASQALNAKFGCEWMSEHENWSGTGETYKLYRLKL